MKKYMQLHDLIINENVDQARELFHEIIVERSREIYESIMDDDLDEDSMGGQVGDLLDEIEVEQHGVMEDDEEFEVEYGEDEDGDGEVDFESGFEVDASDVDDTADDELEDTAIRIEDKVDQILAQLEELVSSDDDSFDADDDDVNADYEAEFVDSDGDDFEEVDVDAEVDSDDELAEGLGLAAHQLRHGKLPPLKRPNSDSDARRVMASVRKGYDNMLPSGHSSEWLDDDDDILQDIRSTHPTYGRDLERYRKEQTNENVELQKVSVTHGDDGAQRKSPIAANSGKAGMASKPVDFSSSDEKGRAAPTVKELPGASSWKNLPGKKSQDLSAAPKPKHGDDGANTKSPVAESRVRSTRTKRTRK